MSLWYPRISPHPTASSPGFSSLFRMLDEFDKYARDIGHIGSHSSSSDSIETFSPKFDVSESEKEYTLQGELPGVTPDNVNIEFTDPQTLVVRGHTERKHEEGDPSLRLQGNDTKKIEGSKSKESSSKEVSTTDKSSSSKSEGPKYWLSERSFGEFSRVFSFPTTVDQDKVNAKFNSGILDITVPKCEKRGTKKISIQS
ncbi:putative heat shock protein [Podospora australis]|uniref:Heat shock protein n=1 Tax=Podospora australis TaxID=1536484 RepID=A0AAN6WPR6_9PEZI|nr:putative heat shock protein [Podospora australis]